MQDYNANYTLPDVKNTKRRIRSKIMLIENTSKPGGRIPIPYGSVGKGFSVPVAYPHPAPHRVPPRLIHLKTDTV